MLATHGLVGAVAGVGKGHVAEAEPRLRRPEVAGCHAVIVDGVGGDGIRLQGDALNGIGWQLGLDVGFSIQSCVGPTL